MGINEDDGHKIYRKTRITTNNFDNDKQLFHVRVLKCYVLMFKHNFASRNKKVCRKMDLLHFHGFILSNIYFAYSIINKTS